MSIFGDIIGAVTGIAGEKSQKKAAEATAASNKAIAEQNLQSQEKINQQNIDFQREQNALQRAIAERLLNLQLEGSTDARGTSTRYVDGQGFVTTLGPQAQAIQNASDAETLQRTITDNILRRQGLQDNATRRAEEGRAADVFLNRTLREPTYSPESIIADLTTAATSGINSSYDNATNAAATQALRSGRSNAGSLLETLAKQRAEALSGAKSNANVQGRQLYEQLVGGEQTRNANLANTFGSRAANIDNVAFTPINLQDTIAANLTSGISGNAGNFTATAPRNSVVPTNTYQATPAQFDNSGTISAIGNTASGVINSDFFKNLFNTQPTQAVQVLNSLGNYQDNDASYVAPRGLGNQ